MLRERFHGPFRSALARHHASGAVLHDRCAPAGPADGVAVRAGWWTTAAVLLAIAAFRIAEARGYRFRAGLRALPRRKRRPAPRPSRGAVAALCGFWLMAGSALMPSAASAEFRYVAPSARARRGHRAGRARRPRRRNGATLAQTLKRLAPPRSACATTAGSMPPRRSWTSIPTGRACCSAKGSRRFAAGGELHIRPAGLPPGAVELADADRGHGVLARRSRRHPAGRAGALGCAGRSRSAVSHRPALPPAPRPGVRRRLHRRRAGAVLRASISAPARGGIHRRLSLPRGDPSRAANTRKRRQTMNSGPSRNYDKILRR